MSLRSAISQTVVASACGSAMSYLERMLGFSDVKFESLILDLRNDGVIESISSDSEMLNQHLSAYVGTEVWRLPHWSQVDGDLALLQECFTASQRPYTTTFVLHCNIIESQESLTLDAQLRKKIAKQTTAPLQLVCSVRAQVKGIAAELKTSYQLAESVLDTIPDCIKLISADGRVESMSAPGMCLMEIDDFGTVQGAEWHSLWPTETQSTVQSSFHMAMEGKASHFSGFCPTAKGTPKWWDVTVSPIKANDGSVVKVLAISRDMTLLHQLDVAALETESRFQTLANGMAQFAWMADASGSVFWYNQRWYDYTGTTLEQMRGWGWRDVHHPAHLDRVVKKISVAFDNGEPWEDTFPLRGKDGTYRWFLSRMFPNRDESGKVTHWLGTNTDITETLNTQEELRRNEEKLLIGTEVAGLGLGEIDYFSNTVAMSPLMAKIYGFSESTKQVSRTVFHGTFHPDDRPIVVDQIERSMHADGDTSMQCEHRILVHDRVRWLQICKKFFYITLPNDSRIVSHAIMAVRDITEQKELEIELRNARRLADAANQAKSDFLANMSHEIRSPMTSILGYAELLQPSDDEEKAKIDTIRSNGEFLLSLVNDILDLSKIEAGKMELDRMAFAPGQIVEDVCSMMNVRAHEKNLNLTVHFDSPIPVEIEGDAIRLRQILINLVGNAVKFTEHGTISLRTRYSSVSDSMIFAVTDTGIGISEAHQTRLFQNFEQGDSSIARKFGGSGLGLAISQRLAQMLNGEISVESELGKGSTFCLTLNNVGGKNRDMVRYEQIVPEPKPLKEDTTDEAELVGEGLRILVVDDRRDIRLLTAAFVKRIGGEVLLAEDGQTAIQLVEQSIEQSNPYDMVLMDVQMPNIDGLTAVRAMRQRGATLPIVALTANAMDSDRAVCLEAGYSDYLSKPVQFSKFVEIVRHHCRSQKFA